MKHKKIFSKVINELTKLISLNESKKSVDSEDSSIYETTVTVKSDNIVTNVKHKKVNPKDDEYEAKPITKPKYNLLSLCRCEASDYNKYGFGKYHYLATGASKGAKCFLVYNGKTLVAFCSVINHTHKGCSKAMQINRVVVLPEFRGRGIGSAIINLVAGIFKNEGMEVYMKCENEKIGKSQDNNCDWQATSYNHKSRKASKADTHKTRNLNKCYCHKYVGKAISGYEWMVKPIAEMRKSINMYRRAVIKEVEIVAKLNLVTEDNSITNTYIVCRVLGVLVLLNLSDIEDEHKYERYRMVA